jgi:hypothetical protein
MGVIVSGTANWIAVNRELLEKDVDGASDTIKKIEHHQERMEQLNSLIKNTFAGATGKIMTELKSDIGRFFNVSPDGILGQTLAFINEYPESVDKYHEKVAASGFSSTLNFVFQEFKQSLDKFMSETISPEIARFSGEMEDRIKNSLESVAKPYYAMASNDIADLKASVSSVIEQSSKTAPDMQSFLDMDALKRIAGAKLPSSTAALQYYSKVRVEAVMRLGLYSVKSLFKRALKKSQKKENTEKMLALADGIRLIKHNTEKSIVFHFENYRENFKFQYISRLLNAGTEHLNQLLTERFNSYNADINTLEKMMHIHKDIDKTRKKMQKSNSAIETQKLKEEQKNGSAKVS